MNALRSCLYEGVVRHRRHHPVRNEFRYSMFQVMLDLDELDTVFAGRLLWSASRTAFARFRREDHYGDPQMPLKHAIADLVATEAGWRPNGPIALLTHLRYFGYVMNPVSFYYCYDEAGEQVKAIVAEIHNTPWGERHCYVLSTGAAGEESQHRFHFDKQFHVSPFMAMDQQYSWRFGEPGDTLTVAMENLESGTKIFDASMSYSRTPITGLSLARVLAMYPLVTAKVVGAIYWQAFKLWLKRCPFYEHPDRKSADQVTTA